MDYQDAIADDEIIRRRILPTTPGHQTIQELPGEPGRFRATSMSLKESDPGAGLSCSRLLITSPRSLLEQLRSHGFDPAGWSVAVWRAAEIRRLRLSIESCPTESDSGHREIRDQDSGGFPSSKSVQSKLAKASRILSRDEIDRLPAGGNLEWLG